MFQGNWSAEPPPGEWPAAAPKKPETPRPYADLFDNVTPPKMAPPPPPADPFDPFGAAPRQPPPPMPGTGPGAGGGGYQDLLYGPSSAGPSQMPASGSTGMFAKGGPSPGPRPAPQPQGVSEYTALIQKPVLSAGAGGAAAAPPVGHAGGGGFSMTPPAMPPMGFPPPPPPPPMPHLAPPPMPKLAPPPMPNLPQVKAPAAAPAEGPNIILIAIFCLVSFLLGFGLCWLIKR